MTVGLARTYFTVGQHRDNTIGLVFCHVILSIVFRCTTTPDSCILPHGSVRDAPTVKRIIKIFATARQHTVGDFLLELFGFPSDHRRNDQHATRRS